MLKRILIPALLILTILGLSSGCTQKDLINGKDGGIDTGTPSPYTDGTYLASSSYYDSYGYGQRLTLGVTNGIISQATFEELNHAGTAKTDSPTSWPTVGAGVSLGELYTNLSTALIKDQGTDNIDTVSGATQTTTAFKALADTAMKNAAAGITTQGRVSLDQTYNATGTPSATTDYTGVMSVTYVGDKITEVTYDEVKDGAPRSANLAYKQLFASMAKETVKKQSLEPLAVDPNAAEESASYNALLEAITAMRTAF